MAHTLSCSPPPPHVGSSWTRDPELQGDSLPLSHRKAPVSTFIQVNTEIRRYPLSDHTAWGYIQIIVVIRSIKPTELSYEVRDLSISGCSSSPLYQQRAKWLGIPSVRSERG